MKMLTDARQNYSVMKGDNYREGGCLKDRITAIAGSKSKVIETFYIVSREVFISSC